MTDVSACPFHAAAGLPTDGMPLSPSPTLAAWRDAAPSTPLLYADGHEGLIVTRHDLAQQVLSDPRFSQTPWRFPAGQVENDDDELDDAARASIASSNLLSLDAPQHSRIRRSITSRFSVRSVRGYQDFVASTVARQLEHLRAQGSPVDLTAHYAEPISAKVHCFVLGVPTSFADRFVTLFVHGSSTQQKFDFIREVIAAKHDDLGEDVLSDLIRSELTASEVEGVVLVLMTSGRDSVAYMIATTTVALLRHPDQLAALRDDPTLILGATEEFMRFGAMFVTVFPRTATEDLELAGVPITAGQSVSVSPVAANRDERRFENPERFDISRDAFGHLGFGHGQHGCVGQQLARLEIREGIMQLITGIPTLALVHADQLAPMPFAHPVATYEAGAVVVAWS